VPTNDLRLALTAVFRPVIGASPLSTLEDVPRASKRPTISSRHATVTLLWSCGHRALQPKPWAYAITRRPRGHLAEWAAERADRLDPKRNALDHFIVFGDDHLRPDPRRLCPHTIPDFDASRCFLRKAPLLRPIQQSARSMLRRSPEDFITNIAGFSSL